MGWGREERFPLKAHPFGALELTCGQSPEEKNVVPIVGSSNSHGTVNSQWFGLSKMIVLSKTCGREDIIDAVKNRRVVVLEQYHGEGLPHVYGENRALEFVLFLLNEYLPLHDELCFEEGRLMKAYACGDKASGEALRKIGMRTEKLFEKYWA